jgi:hypothetical protein
MHRIKTMFIYVILFSLTACTKDPANLPDKVTGKGVERPAGQPTGDLVEKLIGSAGGTLTSDDGQIELVIPEGALNSETTIGIEPVTRTLVDRSGNIALPAYRLTPHGRQFLKPVSIRFRYSSASLANIAYQDEEGKWRGIGNRQVNEADKTVTVQSTHFSDWTTYESIFMEPGESIAVEKGKTATLKVMSVTSMALAESDQGKEEFYLDEPSPIPAPVDWRIVNGPGNGTIAGVPTRATAIFNAPGTIPSNNPVEVEAKVDLKSQGYMLLFTNITITDAIKPGIHLRINGGNWIHFIDTESFVDGESYVGSEGDFPYDRHSIYIRIAGGKARGTGSWAWNDLPGTENETTFEYNVKKPAPLTSYPHRYRNNDFDVWHMSPGYIRITEFGPDQFGDVWATGEFLIERSTPFIENFNGTPPPSRVEGNFKLRME